MPPLRASTSRPASASSRCGAELGVESFGLNLMLLEPGQRGRVHRHERQEEVYIVLEGTLTLELDGGEVHTLQRARRRAGRRPSSDAASPTAATPASR